MHLPSASGELTAAPPASPTPMPASTPKPPNMPQTLPQVREPSLPPALYHSQRIQRPSCHTYDIMDGKGITTQSTPKPSAACDPEMPGLLPVKEVKDLNEAEGAWAMLNGKMVLLEDFKGFEEALLAETSDVEVLKP